jgi:UPF0716 protein FxsA
VKWLLLLYPWLELWSLIELGGQTTPLVSLAWVLGALMLGGSMIRWAGRNSLQRLAQASAGGTLAQQLLLADFAMILSGLLLAIPGLVSDLLAVLILITPLRRLAAALLTPHVRASTFYAGSRGGREDIIEGEFSVREGTDHLERIAHREPPACHDSPQERANDNEIIGGGYESTDQGSQGPRSADPTARTRSNPPE